MNDIGCVPHALPVADARIGEGIADIRQQVADQGQKCADHQNAHDQRIIPGHDPHVEELPHAGNGEDRLEDDAAADQPGQGKAEQGYDRQQGVAQGMPVDDRLAPKAPWPGQW